MNINMLTTKLIQLVLLHVLAVQGEEDLPRDGRKLVLKRARRPVNRQQSVQCQVEFKGE